MDDSAINAALLLLRVVLGLTMAGHGYGKFFKGGKIAGTAGWFDSMGMKPGKVHALTAASTEVGAGLMMAAGLFTSLSSAAFVGLMVVAGWTVHRHNGFFIVSSGWEYNLMLSVVPVSLAMIGPGAWSLDRAFGIDDQLDGWVGLAISAGLGVVASIALLAAFYRPVAKTEE